MKRLVSQAGQGDIAAQTELLETLEPRIDRLLNQFHWIQGLERDDIRQEIYVSILEGLSRVDPEIGSPSEYLLKFARWRLLDCLKKIKRRKENMERISPSQVTETRSSTCVDIELLDKRLSVTQRRILRYLLEGYTWREIAKKMGFSVSNIAYHLNLIRKVYGNK